MLKVHDCSNELFFFAKIQLKANSFISSLIIVFQYYGVLQFKENGWGHTLWSCCSGSLAPVDDKVNSSTLVTAALELLPFTVIADVSSRIISSVGESFFPSLRYCYDQTSSIVVTLALDLYIFP